MPSLGGRGTKQARPNVRVELAVGTGNGARRPAGEAGALDRHGGRSCSVAALHQTLKDGAGV
jgi:hypothetical protein